MLIGLFPELDAPGGVQRAGRHMAAVLTEFAASRGMECRILSLNDSPELHRMTASGREFVFTGCDRGKGRFAVAALKAARRKAKVGLAGHPNLAPVARLMKFVAPRMKSIVCTHGVEVWEPLPRMRRRALQKANLVLPRGRVVLTVGRWLTSERYKGMDTLITALPKLLTRWPELQLVAAGEGDDRDWLEDLAEENGVRMHVHFLSGISYAQLAACYSACELFALPSRGEGFGLVYLEAMACGKPVIGGAHGGAPEVIEDGVTGYLVQHGDAVQLATSIETLLANPEIAREMGRRGKQRVENEFRFNAFAKSLKKILRELCES